MTDPRPDSPVATARCGSRPTQRIDSRELLRGSAREVLERISDGDPLDVRSRVRSELRRRFLLLDEQRAVLRAWTRCARYARRLRPRQGLERWLDRQVSAALDDLVADVDWHTAGAPPFEMSPALGLSEFELARACARFNELPFNVRRSFFRVVLEGRPLETLTYPGGPSVVTIAREARRALLVFLAPEPTTIEVRELCDE